MSTIGSRELVQANTSTPLACSLISYRPLHVTSLEKPVLIAPLETAPLSHPLPCGLHLFLYERSSPD